MLPDLVAIRLPYPIINNNNTKSTMTTDTCPFCGAEATHTDFGIYHYDCQSFTDQENRSPLCIEREARKKAEAQLVKVTRENERLQKMVDAAFDAMQRTEALNKITL